MTVVPLASVDDVKAVLGRDLTAEEAARVGAALDTASGLFRRRSGQTFTEGESLVRLKVNGGEVRLRQSPVTEIVSVTDDDGLSVPFAHFGQTLTVPLLSHEFVRVNYKHGASEAPDEVRLCVAGMVARVFGLSKEAKAGMTQYNKTDGPFSEGGTFASWAVGGQIMLAPADMDLADTYRARRSANVIVQTP